MMMILQPLLLFSVAIVVVDVVVAVNHVTQVQQLRQQQQQQQEKQEDGMVLFLRGKSNNNRRTLFSSSSTTTVVEGKIEEKVHNSENNNNGGNSDDGVLCSLCNFGEIMVHPFGKIHPDVLKDVIVDVDVGLQSTTTTTTTSMVTCLQLQEIGFRYQLSKEQCHAIWDSSVPTKICGCSIPTTKTSSSSSSSSSNDKENDDKEDGDEQEEEVASPFLSANLSDQDDVAIIKSSSIESYKNGGTSSSTGELLCALCTNFSERVLLPSVTIPAGTIDIIKTDVTCIEMNQMIMDSPLLSSSELCTIVQQSSIPIICGCG